MPILYLNFKHINCGGCLSSIENCLFRLGIDQFDYDVSESMAKIRFDQAYTTLEKIIECIHHLGYDPHIADLIEDDIDDLENT